jgi:hypothetical protein
MTDAVKRPQNWATPNILCRGGFEPVSDAFPIDTAVLENSVGFAAVSHSRLEVSNHVIARSGATKQSPLAEIEIATLRSQ